MNETGKTIGVWVALALVLMLVFNQFSGNSEARSAMDYSTFLEEVKAGNIKNVVIDGTPFDQSLIVTKKDGAMVRVPAPLDDYLIGELIASKTTFSKKPLEQPSLLIELLKSLLPIAVLALIWIYVMRQMGGGGKGNPMSFGKNRAKLMVADTNPITFAQVAGCDEAKEEVQEVVDFLKDPTRFQSLGGRVPRGILLTGSPGTGKTLLAKAIAGEANVPFYSIAGSDFVEMFVGVGASRVREMFAEARKNSPCIIFIDEIDAVGRHRGSGMGGGNDEREQTLNQLLVEMDGFEPDVSVIVVAATNRSDVLDKALLRPGRFDRQVAVPLPDIRGREQILNVHAKKVPVAINVKLSVLARGTPGFSGADLANLVNEAALFAARRSKKMVDMSDFESAKDKIMMGAERRSLLMSKEELTNTAYHESGHAVVACLLGNADPVHKVTIIPRGRALGVTMQLPEQDKFSHDKEYMMTMLAILFGGRIAEELFMNQMTTGASNDFERATQLARDMVTRYGMSTALGPMVYIENQGESYYSRSSTSHLSETTLQAVDAEVRRIIDQQYQLARRLLEENRDKVEAMTAALLEFETIDMPQIQDIMAGLPCRLPEGVEPKKLASPEEDTPAPDARGLDVPATDALV
jgi:cell division protease FtsH